MHLQNLLVEIAERGIALTYEPPEDCLNAKPTEALSPELVIEIKRHKQEIVELIRENQRRREDKRLEETGVIQSEQQVFEIARAWFGSQDHERK